MLEDYYWESLNVVALLLTAHVGGLLLGEPQRSHPGHGAVTRQDCQPNEERANLPCKQSDTGTPSMAAPQQGSL